MVGAVLLQGSAKTCPVGNLRAGCLYRVRVRAKNGEGFGPYSLPADVRTSADIPEPPPAPHAESASSDALSVTWDAPDYDGGSRITSYRLELCRGPCMPAPPHILVCSYQLHSL